MRFPTSIESDCYIRERFYKNEDASSGFIQFSGRKDLSWRRDPKKIPFWVNIRLWNFLNVWFIRRSVPENDCDCIC